MTPDLSAIPRNKKGIEVNLISKNDRDCFPVYREFDWYAGVSSFGCESIANGTHAKMRLYEQETIRDLMRAGF